MAKGIKTGGREKGTPNRTTRDAREMLLSILEEYQENQLYQDLEAVKPEARLKFMADLMKHLIPKPKAQEEKEQTKPSKVEVVIHRLLTQRLLPTERRACFQIIFKSTAFVNARCGS